jgi:hypothetical protein
MSCSFLLTGCSHDFRLMKIEETLNRYGEAIRWGMFQTAMDFQAGKSLPLADLKKYKEIRITSYEPIYRHEKEEGHLLQTVEIRYIHENDLVERILTDQQQWRYDRKSDRWLLETELPIFK